jgi:alkylation response protein AidB-like acyl-CoA dehydrogenase
VGAPESDRGQLVDREETHQVDLVQRLGLAALEVLGAGDAGEFWHERYLYSRAATIYGGTQQIQRSIISDRVLALPKD